MTALKWQQEREDSDNYVCKFNALRLDICVRYFKGKGWRYAVFYQLSSSLYIDWHDGFESLEVAQEKALVHTHTSIESDSYNLLALLKGVT